MNKRSIIKNNLKNLFGVLTTLTIFVVVIPGIFALVFSDIWTNFTFDTIINSILFGPRLIYFTIAGITSWIINFSPVTHYFLIFLFTFIGANLYGQYEIEKKYQNLYGQHWQYRMDKLGKENYQVNVQDLIDRIPIRNIDDTDEESRQ